MQIAIMNPAPIYVHPRDMQLIVNDSSTLSFPSLMQAMMDEQAALTQEAAKQRQSDSFCDCDSSTKPCKCDTDKETEEAAEAKKSGIAACMDCPYRKSGQCDLWNGEDEHDLFHLLPAKATQADIAKTSDIQTHFDGIAQASPEYDYTHAYAYIWKQLIKNVSVE